MGANLKGSKWQKVIFKILFIYLKESKPETMSQEGAEKPRRGRFPTYQGAQTWCPDPGIMT